MKAVLQLNGTHTGDLTDTYLNKKVLHTNKILHKFQNTRSTHSVERHQHIHYANSLPAKIRPTLIAATSCVTKTRLNNKPKVRIGHT